MTLTQTTNQELIQELQTRIKAGTLGAQVVADEVRETSGSLLSHLDGKTLLFLISLSIGFTLLVGYSIKITSSKVANCNLEFDQNPPITINPN
jgi:hypothetical protein